MPVYPEPSVITPSNTRPIFLKFEIISSGSFVLGTSVGASSTWISVTDSILNVNFEIQKAAFMAIPPLMLVPYSGQWVVSRDGQIVDSDHDLQELSRRFFDANGTVSVYITRVLQHRFYRRPSPRLR